MDNFKGRDHMSDIVVDGRIIGSCRNMSWRCDMD
jgi:hypothetical protein